MDAPPIQFTRTEDEVSIAYWTVGEGPPLLVIPNNGAAHAALIWELPSWKAFYEELAQHWTVTYFDPRGSGLSEREVTSFELEVLERDVVAVVRAAGLERFALLGEFPSALVAIRYARDHADCLTHLILWHSWAEWAEVDAAAPVVSALPMAGRDWSTFIETMAFRALGPDATARNVEDFNTLANAAMTTEQYAKYLDAMPTSYNVAELLPEILTPTLLIHHRECAWLPVSVSRKVAERLPNAQLVVPEGKSVVLGTADPPQITALLERFLAQGGGGDVDDGTGAASPFRAILFTDVVASTPLLAQLKDAKMREVMRDHDAILQAAVDEHGGRVVKEMGDAFMAEFAVPSAAVECAIAMQRGIQAQFADTDVPIRLRIGINAGEPIAEDDDLHGISVNIAKRLESAAATNGILVSDVVKQMVMGKDFEFADQGEVSLKGFDEPVRAWSVGWV